MTRGNGDRPTPEDLLSAYADDALDAEDTAAVDAYLAGSAEARAELAEVRELIIATRATQATPSAEPPWNQMARDIREACEADLPRSFASRLGELLWPRYVVGAALLAAAAILLWIAVPGGSKAEHGERATATVSAPEDTNEDADIDIDNEAANQLFRDDLRTAELDELDDDEIDGLIDALDDDDSDQWSIADNSGLDDDLEYATGFGLDLFAEPDYDELVEDLTDSEIEAVDDFLTEAQAG